MNNVFPVPDELSKKIKSVSDNRQPGQEIRIDPKKFVQIFRKDLEEWLMKLAEQRAQTP